MTIKDYFKVGFKKPEINETISKILDKKVKLKTQLESCYSRLESIELCNTNSKPKDALLLSEYLFIDILNLLFLFNDKSTISSFKEWEEKAKTIPGEEIGQKISNHIALVNSEQKSEESKSEEIESSLSDLLIFIEIFIFKKNKAQFENPIDDHQKKVRFQFVLGLIILTTISFIGVKAFQKYKPIKNDITHLHYLKDNNTPADASNLLTAPVSPSQEWIEVSFILPQPEKIKNVKIEPIHQINGRFQIKEIKYLDEKKNVLMLKDFKLSMTGLFTSLKTNEICCTENLKPGKLIPDKFLEMETTNNSPSLILKLQETEKVKEIILTLRYIKNLEKFKD